MHILRWLELTAFFLCTPLLLMRLVSDLNTWLMPILGAIGMVCLVLLLVDPTFKRFRLINIVEFRQHFRSSILLFIPSATLLLVVLYSIAPEHAFTLPLQHTQLWLLTLLIYPLVSVVPQEIIFRTFFFHRYKKIIPSKAWRWIASSMCFGLAHVVYANWIAVILSMFAGILFGYRYMQTRSTPIVILEHTLWGSLLFSTGIGMFFLTQ
ncbi:CPBP family intramembrane metalloprotease [Thalassotalea sp. M1531]|uniref:CPBP family intramembrane metalloprotease n=2 Tax=Thalassotalea algicola TaxID=2716224 RepID=A0A7Y0LAC2_9GAMM|nr:CPBP family intramembrane metalloprotease [Thalassotalea algicola]